MGLVVPLPMTDLPCTDQMEFSPAGVNMSLSIAAAGTYVGVFSYSKEISSSQPFSPEDAVESVLLPLHSCTRS